MRPSSFRSPDLATNTCQGSGKVTVTWLGLPVVNDPFDVCDPSNPDPCPYVEGPMAIEFDLDLSGSPGGAR